MLVSIHKLLQITVEIPYIKFFHGIAEIQLPWEVIDAMDF